MTCISYKVAVTCSISPMLSYQVVSNPTIHISFQSSNSDTSCHGLLTRHRFWVERWIYGTYITLNCRLYNTFVILYNLKITTGHSKSFWSAVSSCTHCLVMASNNGDPF
jgi:hypothetical protein